ncbi:MAG: sulfotransferase [Xanthomonadales bacterium]|nr:sulfotransferase [Xanthomonadales bacterium]
MTPSPDLNPLAAAEQALTQSDFERCVSLCETQLSRDAVNLQAHLLRGLASNQLGNLQRAIDDLVFVLEREPGQAHGRLALAQALRKNGHFESALSQLEPLWQHAQLRPHALFEAARANHSLGRASAAIAHYQTLLQEHPNHAGAAANLAALLEKTNALDEALAWADRALRIAPANRSARLTRAACLRRLGRLEEAVEFLQSMLAAPLPPMSEIMATNQLAQAMDRLGNYREAFALYSRANALQQEHDPAYGLDHTGPYGLAMADFLRDWLRNHPPADWSPTPPDDRAPPVFLLGFPRSGTTLLDRVLGAHPRMAVIEERELFLEIRRRWMSRESFPQFQQMSAKDIAQARRIYRAARADACRDPDAQLVIDKLPLNSMYLPLIYRLFPDARVIFAQRDPRDVCLSCFFQTFELVGAMPYFLRLDTTAAFYGAVMQQAREALDTLPLAQLTVRYEHVVQDLEQETRRITDFLGMAWDPAMLAYREQQTGTAINTPSYQQVSEPIYQRSMGRWQHYREDLAPVLDKLHSWAETLGYPTAGQ